MGLRRVSLPSPLKVAFIGAGYMAEEHMRAFASLSDVTIAGIHSRTRERADKLAWTRYIKLMPTTIAAKASS